MLGFRHTLHFLQVKKKIERVKRKKERKKRTLSKFVLWFCTVKHSLDISEVFPLILEMLLHPSSGSQAEGNHWTLALQDLVMCVV